MVKVFYLINKKKDIESEIFENFQYREEINYRAEIFKLRASARLKIIRIYG